VIGERRPGGGGGGSSAPPPALGRWLFLHSDHLGSPRVVVDDQGNKISSHHYMPFGDEKPLAGRATSNNIKFTGHERDVESSAFDNPDGLDYMMARYYGSSLGRFLRPDPQINIARNIIVPQAWNGYTYALNNPTKYLDSNGRDVEVAANARAAVNFGLRLSHTFREVFAAAKGNHNIKVKVDLAPHVRANEKAESDVHAVVTIDVIYLDQSGKESHRETHMEYHGTATAPLAKGDAGTAAEIGHELRHYVLAAEYGLPASRSQDQADQETDARLTAEAIMFDIKYNQEDDLCLRGAEDEVASSQSSPAKSFYDFGGSGAFWAWARAGEQEWLSRHPNATKVTGE